MDAASYLRALAKAELHIHIEGTLEPELMFKLAKRNKVRLRHKSVPELRKAYDFGGLEDFLDIYYEGAAVLLKDEDFFDLAWAYLLRAKADGVRHAEIFFDPQTHTGRGVPFKAMIEGLTAALEKAERELGITSRLILCFLRHLSEEDALKTFKDAQPYVDRVAAVGLDSSEKGHPPKKFARVFAKARADGLKAVAHAGEEGPAGYIREALDVLKVSRVDHGVRCVEDDELVDRLVRDRVPLTTCPLSNVRLRVFKDLRRHNLKKLLDRGVCVTVNSDDPAYFGGYVLDNFIAVHKALDLTLSDMARLAANSIEASFLSAPAKRKLIAEIHAVKAGGRASAAALGKGVDVEGAVKAGGAP